MVRRGLTWMKQAAATAPAGVLPRIRNHRLVNFHQAARSGRVSGQLCLCVSGCGGSQTKSKPQLWSWDTELNSKYLLILTNEFYPK